MNAEAIRNIKALAGELAVGEQLSGQICPDCKGGATGEASFSIKRERYSAFYMCHRDSCSLKGGILLGSGNDEVQSLRKPRKRNLDIEQKLLTPSIRSLGEEQHAYLRETFGLDLGDVGRGGWLWDYEHNRMWMPIWGPPTPQRARAFLGFVLRSFDKNEKLKALTIISTVDVPTAAWYCPILEANRLVIVEDQISAVKASRSFNSLALLGTNLSEDLIDVIKQQKYKNIVLCLDKDAFKKGLKYQKQYGELFDSFVVVQPEKDLKYLTDKQIKDLVNK